MRKSCKCVPCLLLRHLLKYDSMLGGLGGNSRDEVIKVPADSFAEAARHIPEMPDDASDVTRDEADEVKEGTRKSAS